VFLGIDINICKNCFDIWTESETFPALEYLYPHGKLKIQRAYTAVRDFIETRRKCRICGCTWERGCIPPCTWVEWDLCSSCA
jgi:hypothetical protein